MIVETTLLAIACVLFVNMGLSDALQDFFGLHIAVLSCVKCLTFWCILVYLICVGARFYQVVSVSFIYSYLALWLDIGLSALNKIYNEQYKQILSAESSGKSKGSNRRRRDKAYEDYSGMSSMRKKK